MTVPVEESTQSKPFEYKIVGATLERNRFGKWVATIKLDHPSLKLFKNNEFRGLVPDDFADVRIGTYDSTIELTMDDPCDALHAASIWFHAISQEFKRLAVQS